MSIDSSILAVLGASVLGSLHCAGMCGGFAVVCATNSRSSMPNSLSSAAYHGGRLCTYLALGALSATVGAQVTEFAGGRGFPQLLGILVSIVLILQGAFTILPALRRQETRFGRAFARLFEPLRALLLQRIPRSSSAFPFAVGLLSTLLPCPWLYSFVALAATSASVGAGMLLMAVFWLGTLPLLLVFSGLTHILSPKLLRAAPLFAGVLVLAAGFYSLSTHLIPHDHSQHMHQQMDHGAHRTPSAPGDPQTSEHPQHTNPHAHHAGAVGH